MYSNYQNVIFLNTKLNKPFSGNCKIEELHMNLPLNLAGPLPGGGAGTIDSYKYSCLHNIHRLCTHIGVISVEIFFSVQLCLFKPPAKF